MEKILHTHRSARLAVAAIFAVNGFVIAGWVSRIPEIQDKFTLDEQQLGFLLLGLPIGLIASLSFVGGLIDHYGSDRVTLWGGIGYAALLPFLAIAPAAVVVALFLAIMGVSTAGMDIAMNAQAVEVERTYRRSIMASFHAAFSVGNFIGAGFSSLVLYLGVAMFPQFLMMSAIGVAVVVGSFRFLLHEKPPHDTEERPKVFSLPSKILLPLGIIAFCSSIGEGSMLDWSAVYLRRVVGTSESTAVWGFAAFALMMTMGRFFGDRFIERFNRMRMVRAGGMIAGTGLFLAVLIPQTLTVIIGFACVGIGLSVMIPIVFSGAGNTPGIAPGRGVASVATLGYSGFLLGPPLIGFVARYSSLRVSMALVGCLAFLLVYLAKAVRPTLPAEAVPVEYEAAIAA